MIEVIGTVSILAIIAAVVTPKITTRMDQAARDAEATSLAALSEGLVRSTLAARQIPAAANIPAAIAAYMDHATNAVRANKRNLNRVYLAHPNIAFNSAGLPYNQSAAGSTNPPTNARFLIISSVAKALPTINPANFDNIWATPKNSVPSSMSSWGGQGTDLLVERIELRPRFHKVVMMNLDKAPALGPYTADTTDTNLIATVASGVRVAAYFMEGTVINLYRPDGGLHVLDFSEVVRQDVSLVFQNGRWGRGIAPKEVKKGGFGELVDLFLQQPVPCDPDVGATQQAVVNSFYSFLWGYADWAFGDSTAVPPISSFAGLNQPQVEQYPGYSVVKQAVDHMSGSTASYTENLIE